MNVRLVKDLQASPELQHALDFMCRVFGEHARKKIEESLKLRWHYGGQAVICRKTKEGLSVVAAGVPSQGKAAFDSLGPSEWNEAVVYCPEPWDESEFTPLDAPPSPMPESCTR
jgi:hypothetical protein